MKRMCGLPPVMIFPALFWNPGHLMPLLERTRIDVPELLALNNT